MNQQSGFQLMRQGAWTAIGSLMVYGAILATTRLIESRQPKAAAPCGCTGGK